MWLHIERILTHTQKIYHSNYPLVQFHVYQMVKIALWSFIHHSACKITEQYPPSSLPQNNDTALLKYSEIINYT